MPRTTIKQLEKRVKKLEEYIALLERHAIHDHSVPMIDTDDEDEYEVPETKKHKRAGFKYKGRK